MNDDEQRNGGRIDIKRWGSAFLLLLGILAIMGAIKYGTPWLWSIIGK